MQTDCTTPALEPDGSAGVTRENTPTPRRPLPADAVHLESLPSPPPSVLFHTTLKLIALFLLQTDLDHSAGGLPSRCS